MEAAADTGSRSKRERDEERKDEVKEVKKRRSRFMDAEPIVVPVVPMPPASLAVSQDASKIASELEAKLAKELAEVSSLLQNAKQAPLLQQQQQQLARKAVPFKLLVDSQGREIDEQGNVIVQDVSLIKTAAVNKAGDQAQKKAKKENPYLAHRTSRPAEGEKGGPPGTGGDEEVDEGADVIMEQEALVDPRLIFTDRNARARKALNFVEAGKYIEEAEKTRLKEERKVIAGYTSGRKILERKAASASEKGGGSKEGDDDNGGGDDDDDDDGDDDNSTKMDTFVINIEIPPPCDGGVVPSMEWWDEAFLPKEIRESRRKSFAAANNDNFSQLDISNSKTFRYVQHPVSIKPLGGEKAQLPLPMFLTEKERKRIRKTSRREKEQEKRDKQSMGLIPAPEPKFKLSNFMKILGDQAVADPSKVELKVLEQIRHRQLTHEMRNQAAKLTPAERKEKKLRKLQEDTSKEVHVAIFRIADFSSQKFRFKVDVNAQQYFLSGLAMLNEEKGSFSLVIAEGGPKGIRKFSHLLTRRIAWGSPPNPLGGEENDNDDEDEDMDDADEDGGNNNEKGVARGGEGNITDHCKLLWQGSVPKRSFTGFKFQECRNASACRKYLEAKQVAHYWDMAANTKMPTKL